MLRSLRTLVIKPLLLVTALTPCLVPLASRAAIVPDMGVFAAAETGELLVQYAGDEEVYRLSYTDNVMAAQALAQLEKDSSVVHAQPNFVYQAAAFADDPLTSLQGHLEVIEAYRGWDIATSAQPVVIAVIDSGVDIDHPDLEGNIWSNPLEKKNDLDDDGNDFVDDLHGWDFIENSADPRPKLDPGTPENSIGVQHGTSVAGIIAADGNNGIGIAGVAWSAQMMSLRVLNQFGSGNSENVTKALKYAIEQQVDIINLSLVGTNFDEFAVQLLEQAYQEGIIVVAAAGNNGINLNVSKTYPVCYTGHGAATVIGVGAITDEFTKPGFSNYGSDCVDVVAPGVKVFTTRHVESSFKSQEQYAALYSGTSFSAPQITGAIALMKGMRPSLTAEQALYLLQQGSTRLDIASASAGFDFALNIAGTLTLLRDGDFDTNQPIDKTPPIQVSLPEFIAYPRGPYEAVAYHYQMPGPILLSPIVLGEDALKSGMRFSREAKNKFIVNAWRPGSKKVWRYSRISGELAELFMVPIEGQQTVGNVAVGNVDFDAALEYIVAAGPQSKPLIGVYTEKGDLKFQFQAYEDAVTGGLDVKLVDANKDGLMEIVTVPVSQTSGHVKLFEYTGALLAEFNAYGPNFRGGATISVADVDADGSRELIVGPGAGGGPHVKVFSTEGDLVTEFFAGEVIESSGAMVDFYDLDQDGKNEYVISYHQGHQSILRTYRSTGVFQSELGVFDPKFTGAIGVLPL